MNEKKSKKFIFLKWRGRSFSLIELLVVMAVIGILTTITVIAVQGSRQKTKIIVAKAALLEVGNYLANCAASNNGQGTAIQAPADNSIGGGSVCEGLSDIWPSLKSSGWLYSGPGTGDTPMNPTWLAQCDASVCGINYTATCKTTGCTYVKTTPSPTPTQSQTPYIAFTNPHVFINTVDQHLDSFGATVNATTNDTIMFSANVNFSDLTAPFTITSRSSAGTNATCGQNGTAALCTFTHPPVQNSTVTIGIQDAAGHTGTTPAWNMNIAAAPIIIYYLAEGQNVSKSQPFSFTAKITDDVQLTNYYTYYVKIDSTWFWTAGPSIYWYTQYRDGLFSYSNINLSSFSLGLHTIYITATDNSGNSTTGTIHINVIKADSPI